MGMTINFANVITNLKCEYCNKDNEFSVGRKLHGGSDDRIYLMCSCGAHCTLSISTSIELLQSWWK